MTTETENNTKEARSSAAPGSAITVEELKAICDATVRLVEIRQRGCAHLCVENVAPEIMHKLMTRLRMHKDGLECVTGFERFEEHWPNAESSDSRP